jgi:beta-glucosidase
MCNYNRVNGSYGCQNSKIINGLLKTELGFQGYVMSDWLATRSGVASVEAGLDMDMPGNSITFSFVEDKSMFESYFGRNITIGVHNGTIPMDRLDDMIMRIMTPYYFLQQDADFPSIDPTCAQLNSMGGPSTWFRQWNLTGEASRDVRDNHGALIRRWAAESTVMVKNERDALPLKSPKVIAVYGNDAGEPMLGPLNQDDFEYGTLAIGGGSGSGRFSYLVTPLDAIKARAAKDGSLVAAWLNNSMIIESTAAQANAGPGLGDSNLPNEPDVCLVFTKDWASEQVDRLDLDLDWQAKEMIQGVASKCNNTIVITHSPGINMLPFADNPNVTAILIAHFPGQESGNSIVDVLYGDVNPSGKLPYTIAYNAKDYLPAITTNITTNGTDDWQAWFDEKLEIDYRYFDAHDIDVRYEFGFGLSYTDFSMFDLRVSRAQPGSISALPEKQDIAPGGNPDLWSVLFNSQVTVQNTGMVRGKTVAQLYISFPKGSTPASTPPRQLRGFDKIDLAPGQQGVAHFALMRRDISYWDVTQQQWVVPSGEFVLSAGFSSRDIREFARFTAQSSEK